MPRPRLIAMVAFPDFQMLDVMGPLEVFSRTARWMIDHGRTKTSVYRVEVLGLRKGMLRASSGLSVLVERSLGEVRSGIDTLLVSGGRGAPAASAMPGMQKWLRQQASRVRRLGSVCTGTFLLAAAGLLDGRRVTTHWASAAELSAEYPPLRVDADSLFIRDGHVYTSAGVTAGMDLALALVEEDLGRDVALAVARELVMFVRRTGGQSQLSAPLAAQFAQREPVRQLQAWIIEHPTGALSVDRLAARVAMSPRNFARAFVAETGTTPARFVLGARLETARRLLEESSASVEEIAARSGFGSAPSLRRAFEQHLGLSPRHYRQRFGQRDKP